MLTKQLFQPFFLFSPSLLFLQSFIASPACLCLVSLLLFLFHYTSTFYFSPQFNILHLPISPTLFLIYFVYCSTTLFRSPFICISSVCLSVPSILKDIDVVSVCFRKLEIHSENVNLQKEQRGRAELFIPRYHELVPKQEEKKASVCLCWRVCVSMCCSTC